MRNWPGWISRSSCPCEVVHGARRGCNHRLLRRQQSGLDLLRLAGLRRDLSDIGRKAGLAEFETMGESRQRQFTRPGAHRLAIHQQLGIGRLAAHTDHADARRQLDAQRCAPTAGQIHAA